MNRIGGAVSQLNQSVTEQASLGRLGEILRARSADVVNSVARGTSTWEQGSAALPTAKKKFRDGWQTYLDSLSGDEKTALQQAFKVPLDGVDEAFAEAGETVSLVGIAAS
jgi:hypothetical protein